MSEKGRGPGRVKEDSEGGERSRKMEMMLVKYSAQLCRKLMADWKGCVLGFLGPALGELRTHRRGHPWCSASRCLSPEYGPQRLVLGQGRLTLSQVSCLWLCG